MKSLPESELKNLATQLGPKQYLAFNELARRVRDDPSTWIEQDDPDYPRAPNSIEREWALLKCSQHLNDELKREQDVRLTELERNLDEDHDSLEIKYFNAIGEVLSRQR